MKDYLYKSAKALLCILSILASQEIVAQAKVDDATVTVGSTTTITLPLTYRNTLNRSTGITYQWKVSDSSLSITSKTRDNVIIKGNSPSTTAKVYYQCSYYIDGYYRTMNFYWDVTVKSNIVYVTRINLNPTDATLEVGENLRIYATCYPTNATDKSVSWSSSDSSVATVDSYGNVTAVSAGEAVITCRSKQVNSIYSACAITVTAKEPEEPASGKTIVIKPYNSGQLRLLFSEEPVVTLSNGTVTATYGSTTIEYTYDEIESITFEEPGTSVQAIDSENTQNIRFSGNKLLLQGFAADERIYICTCDGIIALSSVCDTEGTANIDIATLSKGIYVASIGNCRIKIYRK